MASYACREAELRKVLALSEREEAERKKEEDERIRRIDEQNSKALFDDSLQMYVFLPPLALPIFLPTTQPSSQGEMTC